MALNQNIKFSYVLLTVITFRLLNQSATRPTSEDGKMLRQLADSYSASLVAFFLHLRVQKSVQTLEKIQNTLDNLTDGYKNSLKLKLKTLEAMDKQLIALEEADYFNLDGTQRIKYFIEQYALYDELYPTELGSNEAKFNSTPEDLLKKLNVMSNDQLITETNNLINLHLKDLEEKESNVKYNQLQRLAASHAKRKLKILVDFVYSEPIINRNHYGVEIGIQDNRGIQIESVLQQFKNVLDLFYPQFTNLAIFESKFKTFTNTN